MYRSINIKLRIKPPACTGCGRIHTSKGPVLPLTGANLSRWSSVRLEPDHETWYKSTDLSPWTLDETRKYCCDSCCKVWLILSLGSSSCSRRARTRQKHERSYKSALSTWVNGIRKRWNERSIRLLLTTCFLCEKIPHSDRRNSAREGVWLCTILNAVKTAFNRDMFKKRLANRVGNGITFSNIGELIFGSDRFRLCSIHSQDVKHIRDQLEMGETGGICSN